MDRLCILFIMLSLSKLWQKTVYCDDSKITESEMIDIKKLLFCICSNISIDYEMVMVLNNDRMMGASLFPCYWHIISIPLEESQGASTKTCGLDDVFPPYDLGSGP